MAYALFNSSAASNYLASFKPAKPVDGFDDVLSTSATDNITRMQELDYSGRVGLAKQAMVELSAQLQNKALLDYYDRRDERDEKQNKRATLANMLGQGGVGGGSSGLSSLNNFLGGTDKTFAQGDKSGKGSTDLVEAMIGSLNQTILGDPDKKQEAANTKAPTQPGVTAQSSPMQLDLLKPTDATTVLQQLEQLRSQQSK